MRKLRGYVRGGMRPTTYTYKGFHEARLDVDSVRIRVEDVKKLLEAVKRMYEENLK